MSDAPDRRGDGGRRRTRRPRPEPTPTQRGLALLTRREHSRVELQRKLLARGVDSDAADDAVERLSEAGWQDDARFAEFLLRSRASAGQGPVRIRAELGMHRLDGEVIARVMSGFEGDWVEIARDLVGRRFGAAVADDPARRRKAAELLYRRGFTGDQVRAATSFDPDES